MSTITLRGLCSAAEKQVRQNARRQDKSINRYIVDLLEDATIGKNASKPICYDDLDEIIGQLTLEDAESIEQHVSSSRKIDQELWT